MSAMQFSLDWLRAQHWQCRVVEINTNYGRKVDLWGFGDILALRQGETLLVQTTTYGNRLARVAKIQAIPEFRLVRLAGWQVHVHGWRDNDDAAQGLEVIDMANLDVIWDTVVRQVGRRKGVPRKQVELRL